MKTYIWTLPTRIVHWLLAIGLVVAFILGKQEVSLNLHSAFGYLVTGLVLFRVIWGFIGPKYSKFSDFPITPKSLIGFFSNMRISKSTHIGHNPFASVIMILIYLDIILIGFTGILNLASEGQGFFSSILQVQESEIIEEMHEICANLLIFLVSFHLIGILVDFIFHTENGTLISMFNGYKKLNGESAKLNLFHKMFSFLWIFIPLIIFILTIQFQNISEEDENENQRNERFEDDD